MADCNWVLQYSDFKISGGSTFLRSVHNFNLACNFGQTIESAKFITGIAYTEDVNVDHLPTNDPVSLENTSRDRVFHKHLISSEDEAKSCWKVFGIQPMYSFQWLGLMSICFNFTGGPTHFFPATAHYLNFSICNDSSQNGIQNKGGTKNEILLQYPGNYFMGSLVLYTLNLANQKT